MLAGTKPQVICNACIGNAILFVCNDIYVKGFHY